MKQRTASKQPDACTRKRPAPRAGTKAGLKTFRRALALTLALCLTLGLIPTGILPEGIDSDFKIEAQAAAPLDSAARAELTNPATNGSWDTPYEKYGELSLKVDEEGDGYNKLWSEKAGEFVQLKGMSTFGLMFDDNGDSAAYKSEGTWALTPEVFDIMAYDWEIDFIRVAMYVTEGGTGVYAQLYNDVNKNYESDPPVAISDPTGRPDIALRRVLKAIDLAVERGLYVMVDWHVLNPGDPNHPDYLAAGTGKKMGKNGLEAFTGAESSAVDWNSKGAGLEAADGGVDVSDFDDFRATTDNNTYGYPAPASMNGPQLFFAYLANRYYERKIEADPSGYGDYTADTLPRASGATELMGSKPLQGKGQIMWEIANEPNLRDWNIETHSRPAEEGGCNAWQRFDSGGLNAHSMGYSWQNIMACNWQNRLLPYMDRVTETIRRFDLNGIIIAGTDNWCQYVDAAVMAKTTMSDYGAGSFVTDPRARRTGDFNNPYDAAKSRVMYTVHFYAGTHDIGYDYDTRSGSQFYPNSDGGNGYSESFNDYGPLGPAPAGTTGAYWLRQKIDNALEGGMALFCTEWGVSGASGDYGPYLDFSERWLDYLAEKGISWSAWSLARKNETSSVTKFSTPNGGTPNAAFLQKRVKSLGGKEYDVPYWAMEDEYQTGFTGTKTDQLSVAGQYIRAKILGDPRALEKYSGGDISRQDADTLKGSFAGLPFTFENDREGWSSEGNILDSRDMAIANVAPAGQPMNNALVIPLDMVNAAVTARETSDELYKYSKGNGWENTRSSWDYGAFRFTSSTGGFLGNATGNAAPPTYGAVSYLSFDVYVEGSGTLKLQILPAPDGYGYWYQPLGGDGYTLPYTSGDTVTTEDGRTLKKLWICMPIANQKAYRAGIPDSATIRNVTIIPLGTGFTGKLYIDNVGFVAKGAKTALAEKYMAKFQTSATFGYTVPMPGATATAAQKLCYYNTYKVNSFVDLYWATELSGPIVYGGQPRWSEDQIQIANDQQNEIYTRAVEAAKATILDPRATLAQIEAADAFLDTLVPVSGEAYFDLSMGYIPDGRPESDDAEPRHLAYWKYWDAATELLQVTGDPFVSSRIDTGDVVVYGKIDGTKTLDLYVNLTKETFTARNFDIKAYSVDGVKWTAINMNSKDNALSPAKFPARLPSSESKSLILKVTDKVEKVGKTLVPTGRIATFGTIKGRPKAPTQIVAYSDDTYNNYPGYWYLKYKGAQEYYSGNALQALTPKNGKSAAATDSWVPYQTMGTRAISDLVKNKVTNKIVFIRVAPTANVYNDEYQAASKSKKLTIKGASAKPKYKIDYAKETIALKNGDSYRVGYEHLGISGPFTDYSGDKAAFDLVVRKAITNGQTIQVRRTAAASGGSKPPSSVQNIKPLGRPLMQATPLAAANGKITTDLKKFEIAQNLTKEMIPEGTDGAGTIRWASKVPAITANHVKSADRTGPNNEIVYTFAIRLKQTSKNAKSYPGWLHIVWGEYATGKMGVLSATIAADDINQGFLKNIELMEQIISDDDSLDVYPYKEEEGEAVPAPEPTPEPEPEPSAEPSPEPTPEPEEPDVPDTEVPEDEPIETPEPDVPKDEEPAPDESTELVEE